MPVPDFFTLSRATLVAGIIAIPFVCLRAESTPADRAVNGSPVWFASEPAVSPDGREVVFSWRRDLWRVPLEGGRAEQITSHPATDSHPMFSPDGGTLYFGSFREGPRHLYAMPTSGGEVIRLSNHSEGLVPETVHPDGSRVFFRAQRDAPTPHAHRIFSLASEGAPAGEEMLFDLPGHSVSLHPLDDRVLFCMNGEAKHRRGYRGSRSSSIWLFESGGDGGERFVRLVEEDAGARTPLWRPDGRSYFYVSERDGTWNVWLHDLAEGSHEQLTFFSGAGVFDPALSADGTVMVFNRGPELWRWHPTGDSPPEPIEITHSRDDALAVQEVKRIRGTQDADFSESGREIAFEAEGRLFVMDNFLRQPNPITDGNTRHEAPRFSKDGAYVYAIEDCGRHRVLVRIRRIDDGAFWWSARGFESETLSADGAMVIAYRFDAERKRLAWVEQPGRLVIADADGREARTIYETWEAFDFDWSPDGRWMAVADRDADFNRDVRIVCVKGEIEPYNVSRHPGNHWMPRWSPDGSMLAFLGQRTPRNTRIHFVHLSMEEHLRTHAQIRRAEAERRMRDDPWYRRDDPGADQEENGPADDDEQDAGEAEGGAGKNKNRDDNPNHSEDEGGPSEGDAEGAEEPGNVEGAEEPEESKEGGEPGIDFDGLFERVVTLNTGSGTPSWLNWDHDSKHLWFQTTASNDNAVYRIEPREGAERSRQFQHRGVPLRVESRASYWLIDNTPAKHANNRLESYSISTEILRDRRRHLEMGFELAGRMLATRFYDPEMNGLDWEAVVEKYRPVATSAGTSQEFAMALQMMMGKLNASHLGFAAETWPPTGSDPSARFRTTRHTGMRFSIDENGRTVVESVIPGSPAHAARPEIQPGVVLVSVNDVDVGEDPCLATLFNGPPDEDVRVVLQHPDEDAEPHEYELAVISFADARSLATREARELTRRKVDELSEGTLGYIHIPRMFQDDFNEFQREIFAAGHGRDGLVIDVRDNQGGFVSDHLLTILTQPQHAMTIPRDGGPGYPGYRLVYTSWSKPVIVLCNEHTYSNGEIFAHAIQTIGRGQLVGRPTAGGVISTYRVPVLDLGRISVPFRGWFHPQTGRDMEMGPAVPDIDVEAHPNDVVRGVDRQLEEAVKALIAEINENGVPTFPDPVYRRQIDFSNPEQ